MHFQGKATLTESTTPFMLKLDLQCPWLVKPSTGVGRMYEVKTNINILLSSGVLIYSNRVNVDIVYCISFVYNCILATNFAHAKTTQMFHMYNPTAIASVCTGNRNFQYMYIAIWNSFVKCSTGQPNENHFPDHARFRLVPKPLIRFLIGDSMYIYFFHAMFTRNKLQSCTMCR